ncbi:phage tail protein [Microbulbifer epialgicus]|uniref:Phage tail protein n=1 Tax=Microbulbifer epialgicus TaxID=393907 RepID=A0ABV4NYM8_9GAMM
MAGRKLQDIFAHLRSANLVADAKIESFMDDIKVMACSKNLGNGIRVSRVEYTAEILIEGFTGDSALVFALVTTWLMEHDSERDHDNVSEPKIEVTPVDDVSVDIEILIPFFESVDLVPDDNGSINYLGQRWAVATVPIDEPNQVAVGDNKELPTDAPYSREN